MSADPIEGPDLLEHSKTKHHKETSKGPCQDVWLGPSWGRFGTRWGVLRGSDVAVAIATLQSLTATRSAISSRQLQVAKAALAKRFASVRALMTFRVGYAFDVGEFGLAGTVSGDSSVLGRRLDPVAPWPLAFWLGGWDADALCGFASGQLTVPFLPGG